MSTIDPGKDIREQAARWVIRMTESPDELSAAERDRFDEWISNPLHAQEFHAIHNIAAIAADLPAADRVRWTDWANSQASERAQSRRQVVRWWAVAASLLTVLVLGGYYAQTQRWFGGEAYLTHKGETRTVTFEEGSVAYLNTQSEVRWIGSKEDRRVALTEGEVLFDVVHDAKRPFRVVLDNSEIRVLGTRFNVYRKPNGDTTVTVIEGAVEVRGFGNGNTQPEWVRTIHANEQIEYRPLGLMREPHATEAQNAVRWRSGIYLFADQSIENVLDELVRYTDERIVIRDPRIAQRRISGGLNTRDVRGALKHLEEYAPIEVKEKNGTFTLDYAAASDPRKGQ